MFSVFQALVYYTFGALGGNLLAHMILVSRFFCQCRNATVMLFVYFNKNYTSLYCFIRATGTGEGWVFPKAVSQH